MTEIRKDPLRPRRIVIAVHRADRPNEYRSRGSEGAAPLVCPFCPGNEHETPPELAADRPPGSKPNDSAWTLRVVPNRYPALITGPASAAAAGAPFERAAALGSHEVVIECRDHAGRLESLPQRQMIRFLSHLRDRTRHHAADPKTAQVLIFRNSGALSGASLAHPHTQLAAPYELSSDADIECARMARHREATSRCLICDLVASERAAATRLVEEKAGLVAFVPFAARYGAELWIGPQAGGEDFATIDDARLATLAELLPRLLAGMLSIFDEPSYNLLLHAWTAPRFVSAHPHWRIEIVPRLANVGGFELATGDYIVSRTPEDVAARMKQAIGILAP
jgi:UDPglucose--hexose-1-phosphate uridylyltransferase